jgi:uncharacterized protein YceK
MGNQMKHFILLFIILSILTLSGCSTKNSVRNDLYSDQVCYYQDDNLTEYEQNMICADKSADASKPLVNNTFAKIIGSAFGIVMLFPELLLLFF